jgi:hypothetical protein
MGAVLFHSKGSWSPLKAKRDNSGKRWNFSYWYTFRFSSDIDAQRLFFWDDDHKECGVVFFSEGSIRPYPQIEHLVEKLVSVPNLRTQYRRELRFPLERYYPEYGSFPEETTGINLAK